MAADQNTRATRSQDRGNDAMSADMSRAIAFERAKDRADARQAAIEAKHPTVFYNQADRSEENSTPGNRVPDPGPGAYKK
jgi:hypothetical protein